MALGFCSPLDQFSRRKGYTIADGRLTVYQSSDTIRATKLVDRGLAGSFPAKVAPSKKRAIIDNVIGIVTSRTLPDKQLRWVNTTQSP